MTMCAEVACQGFHSVTFGARWAGVRDWAGPNEQILDTVLPRLRTHILPASCTQFRSLSHSSCLPRVFSHLAPLLAGNEYSSRIQGEHQEPGNGTVKFLGELFVARGKNIDFLHGLQPSLGALPCWVCAEQSSAEDIGGGNTNALAAAALGLPGAPAALHGPGERRRRPRAYLE